MGTRSRGERRLSSALLYLPPFTPVSTPELLTHSMDDQKRRTAADHYANDTLTVPTVPSIMFSVEPRVLCSRSQQAARDNERSRKRCGLEIALLLTEAHFGPTGALPFLSGLSGLPK
ncbi:hypothetical protein KOW79_005167 [Hemibagrus wyckioides]|uniref:Uncharacterized protein n=1 Tax=Hemibagrus wyckioides TaxID=337641 RepID=A0A9D3P1G7_9TELE|nr:hypothetical protein KOW79_005167 [Hemibagrus wyckioides]